MENLDEKWNDLLSRLQKDFEDELTLKSVLFLIGVQELGQGPKEFTKDQKLDVIHIAICRILEPFGFYKLIYSDQDGWPYYESVKPLPNLKSGEQLKLMKQGILEYFGEIY